MKKYILFDHDGVLVDTECWYYRAGERALADIGLALVVEDFARGLSSAVAAGIECAVVHNDFTQGQDFTLASLAARPCTS